jgi:MFS family permease
VSVDAGRTLRDLARLSAATALVVLAFSTVLPLLAVTLQRQGVSASAIGVFAALPFVTVALVLPWLPQVFARIGAARAYRLGLVLEGLCTLGYALGDGYWLWCACSVLGCVGAAALWNGTEAMIAFNAPPHMRGRVTGLYQTSLGVATAVGPLLPLAVAALWPAAPPLLLVKLAPLAFVAALSLASGVVLARLPVAHRAAAGHTLWTALRARPGLAALAFAGGVFEAGLGAISAAHGAAVGLSLAAATSIAGVLGAGSFLLQYPAGWLADHVDLRRVFVGAGAVLGLASLAFAASGAWPPLLWGTAFCWGAVGGALYTLTMVRVAHDFAASSAIAGAAAMIAGYTAGGAVGPAVSGAMLDRWGVVGQSLWLTLLAGAVLMVALRGEFRRSPAA